MNNTWYQDAITSVYSRVRGMLIAKLKTKYTDIKVTNNSNDISDTKFPTIYIHALQPYERGFDLEGTSINAISLTFQAEVYTKDIVSANEINGIVITAFKQMMFQANMPVFEDNRTGIKRTVSRYTRLLGANDKF